MATKIYKCTLIDVYQHSNGEDFILVFRNEILARRYADELNCKIVDNLLVVDKGISVYNTEKFYELERVK